MKLAQLSFFRLVFLLIHKSTARSTIMAHPGHPPTNNLSSRYTCQACDFQLCYPESPQLLVGA